LGGIGFNVTSIPNGWEALNEAKVHQPDLVISDPLVPGLDGFGLCWEMRKDPQLASIPIILSPLAAATEVDIDLAHALGAAGYISRTPNLEPLSACLKMVFTKNQQAEHVSNASTLPLGKSRGGCWVSTG